MNKNAKKIGTPVLEVGTTCRGFAIGKFNDYSGQECSLQKSSMMAPRGQQTIWLGINNNDGNFLIQPQSAATQAKFGFGWQEKKLKDLYPDCWVSVPDRMHLTQEMVRAMLPALEHFAKTGELPVDKE